MNSMKDMDNGNPLDTPKIAGLRDSKEQANRQYKNHPKYGKDDASNMRSKVSQAELLEREIQNQVA